VALTWADALSRGERAQLSVTGKGGLVRQVLLPQVVSRSLLSLRGDAGANDPVFPSRKGGGRLTERAVNGMVKRARLQPPQGRGMHRYIFPTSAKLALQCSHRIDRDRDRTP
jgi:site-specific recombinase XerC